MTFAQVTACTNGPSRRARRGRLNRTQDAPPGYFRPWILLWILFGLSPRPRVGGARQRGPRDPGAWLHAYRTFGQAAKRPVVCADLSDAETGLTAPLAAASPAAGVSRHDGRIQRLSAALRFANPAGGGSRRGKLRTDSGRAPCFTCAYWRIRCESRATSGLRAKRDCPATRDSTRNAGRCSKPTKPAQSPGGGVSRNAVFGLPPRPPIYGGSVVSSI